MENIVRLAKQYGFVYQGSEIYNGLANTWDFGPLGVEMKNNIKKIWWDEFIKQDKNVVGLDSAILLNPSVWRASGHVGGFTDPLMDCRDCKTRHRADKLIEDQKGINAEAMNNEEMSAYVLEENITCPDCGSANFTPIRSFELMLKTQLGVIDDESSAVYLRPETAQGIFINYKNVLRTSRQKVPFGIGQIGKSFRNEITPGNFIFRTREFEQMELEFFCKPGTELEHFDVYMQKMTNFLDRYGLNNYRVRTHEESELAHYSNKTCDIEFMFPFGWGELWGLASRTDFDLIAHQNGSKVDMSYLDPHTNEKFVPYVIEPSVGAERLFLAFLVDAYRKEEKDGEEREYLKLHPSIAPVKVAILPLVKKLGENAQSVFDQLCLDFNCEYDDAGTIGKRYKRQDIIGTPLCITFDYDSLDDNCVTVRDRDTMEQSRIAISDLNQYVAEKIGK